MEKKMDSEIYFIRWSNLEGDWENGLIHGFGRMTTPDGEKLTEIGKMVRKRY